MHDFILHAPHTAHVHLDGNSEISVINNISQNEHTETNYLTAKMVRRDRQGVFFVRLGECVVWAFVVLCWSSINSN